MRYYVDTCIWRDYWEDRSDGLKPLGEFAFQFFKRAIAHDDTLVISNLVIEELLRHQVEIRDVIDWIRKLPRAKATRRLCVSE